MNLKLDKQGKWVLVALLALFIRTLSAQVIYETPYSVYGLGSMIEKSSSLNRGMAYTGIGVRDHLNLNHVNPASYTSIVSPFSAMFEIGTYWEANKYSTVSSSDKDKNGGLTNLTAWFKFSPKWAGTVTLSPYAGMGYNIKTTRNLGALNDVDYTYEGSGDISRFTFGNAYNVTKNLSVGLNASFLFGSLDKTETVATSSLSTIGYRDRLYVNKFDFDFGAQYKMKINKSFLTVGVVADDGLKMNGSTEESIYFVSGDTLDTIDGDNLDYSLPMSVGLGVSLQSKLSTFAADVRYKQWSEAAYESDEDLSFQDTWRVSAGYSYAGNLEGDTFTDFIGLRAGFYMENYYLTIDGITFMNWGLSAGLTIPLFDGKSSVGLNYAYDRIGSTENGLILQTSQKLMLDVIIRDIWGAKRKYD